MSNQLELFEVEGQPAPCRPLSFSPYQRGGTRRKSRPRFLSRIPKDTNIAAGYRGAEMQGLPMLKQGEEVAAVMEAKKSDGTPLYRTVTVEIPRRGTKTTSIWNVLLGRCDSREGYKVVTTAQDGTRARNRFREVQRALDNADFEGRRSAKNRRGKLRIANGSESIEFDNGSRIWVVPPEPGALRGEAADAMFFDEAGEISPEKSSDLVAGALPLMDTRPEGQVIIAGTPGLVRAGLFWDTLERARAGAKGVGIVDYSIPDGALTLIEKDGELVLNEKLLLATHPGIGTLTKLSIMRERFEAMPLDQFEREYLCRWPLEADSAALSAKAWAECGRAEFPARPEHSAAIGFDVAPGETHAAVVAAWRDDRNRACFELLAYEPGAGWVPAYVKNAWKRLKALPVAHDTIGANVDPAEQLHRLRVPLAPFGLKDMQGAAARFAAILDYGAIIHSQQPDLTRAVEGAAWRTVGEGGRLFARRASTQDVSPLVAATVALWQYDKHSSRARLQVVRAGA